MTITPLAPIKLPPDVRPSTTLNRNAELVMLPLDRLVIDDHYQRPISAAGRRNIVTILECFDWRKFAPIIATRLADGRYAIIDGQHRATAARMHPAIDLVPCMVIDADPQSAAQCFAAINGQVTAMTPGQLFHARVASGEERALQIKAMCDRLGVRLLRYKFPGDVPQPGDTQSVSTVEDIYRRCGEATAVRVLQALLAAGDSRQVMTRIPMRAMLAAAQARPDADLVRVFAGLKLAPRVAAAQAKALTERCKATALLVERLIADIDGRTAKFSTPTQREHPAYV